MVLLGGTILTTFIGDPLGLKPTIQGMGIDMWGGASAPATTTPATTTPATPPVTTPATPVAPVTPATPVTTPAVTGKMSLAINSPIKDRPVAKLAESLKPNLQSVQDAWNAVLAKKADWGNCDVTLTVAVDAKGNVSNVKLKANNNVPKTVSDALSNAIKATNFGTGKAGSIDFTMKFSL